MKIVARRLWFLSDFSGIVAKAVSAPLTQRNEVAANLQYALWAEGHLLRMGKSLDEDLMRMAGGDLHDFQLI